MDIGILVGLIMALGALVLVWPAVRRAGPMAWPALLFWALLIAAVTAGVMLVERWNAPPSQPLPPPSQRGTVT
jgi:hypothetical protein